MIFLCSYKIDQHVYGLLARMSRLDICKLASANFDHDIMERTVIYRL